MCPDVFLTDSQAVESPTSLPDDQLPRVWPWVEGSDLLQSHLTLEYMASSSIDPNPRLRRPQVGSLQFLLCPRRPSKIP